MFRVSLDAGATWNVVEDLHKFIADENPRDIEVRCLRSGDILWRYHMYSKFLYLKNVPHDTSVFTVLPRGTNLHAPACRICNLPHEHVSHFNFAVRHFKYDHPVTRTRLYEWLKHLPNAQVYFDEYINKIPRHLQEQFGCTGLHALYYAPEYAAYSYDTKMTAPNVSPMISNDPDVQTCNYV